MCIRDAPVHTEWQSFKRWDVLIDSHRAIQKIYRELRRTIWSITKILALFRNSKLLCCLQRDFALLGCILILKLTDLECCSNIIQNLGSVRFQEVKGIHISVQKECIILIMLLRSHKKCLPSEREAILLRPIERLCESFLVFPSCFILFSSPKAIFLMGSQKFCKWKILKYYVSFGALYSLLK